MLSDEERQAIEVIKGLAVYYDDYSLLDKEEIEENEEVNNSINIVINLFEKQSKEIEELNSDLEVFKRALTDVEVVYNKNYTSNDKIKAKIEEQEKIINTGGIDFNTKTYARCKKKVLQSLLEKE